MKRKKRIGLLTLLSLFVASILTATSFGYWNLSSEVSVTVSENTQNVETKVNQYTSDRAVCYLDDAPTVFYTSIEKALSVAISGRTIYVIPGLKDDDKNSYPIHIKNNCTIPSGVTLSLPYNGTTVFDSTVHGPNTNFADYSLAAVKTNRQTQVIIDENVTLTVLGTLNIGGIIGAPSAGVSGNTTGSYCEITMSANSQIVCESGSIYCYGYIKRTAASNNSLLTIGSTGKLHSPFVIYDFKGGSATLGIYNLSGDNRFCPFAVFDVCNVQTKTLIKSGAYWETRTLVYIGTNDTYYPEKDADKIVNFISPSSTKTAIILTSGYLTTEYTPQTNGITSANASSSNTLLTIYGTAEIGSISLNMTVTAAIIKKEISIDTSNFFFPISYRLSITVENGGILNVSKKVKAMNGSDLLVKKGGTVNITNQLIVYDDFVENTASLPSPYPSGLPAATLVNNGVINVTGSGAIGGYINTTEAGATLNYQSTIFSVSSPEYGGTMPSGSDAALKKSACSVTQYTKNTMGSLTNENDVIFDGQITQTGSYLSTINPNNSLQLYWRLIPVQLTDFDVTVISTGQDSDNGWTVVEASPTPENASAVTYSWEKISTDSNLSLSSNTGNSITIYNKSSNNLKCTIKVTATDYYGNSIPKEYTFDVGKKECFAKGTKILMSNGEEKEIQFINKGDSILTWNFFTSQYEEQKVAFVIDHGTRQYEILKLHFSNGENLSIIGDHGIFDYDLNKYVYITLDNYSSYIGHNFVSYLNSNEYCLTKLVSGEVNLETTNAYSITTEYNYNAIANKLFTAPPPENLYNWIEMSGKLQYDVEKFNSDVETYGLYDYSVFEPYGISYYTFETFNGAYLRIPVEKGIFSFEYIIEQFNMYKEWIN